MTSSKSQYLSILFFVIIFMTIYFGCDTKNEKQRAVEKSRAQNIELISADRLIREARPKLSANGNSDLLLLEEKLASAQTDSVKVETLKAMASLWYSEKYPLISGHFAEKIAALLKNDESAWSIAGTTYAIAAQRVTDEIEKKHATLKSRAAFENVLSLNSENVENSINLALSYVELPEKDNPMKGILMLLDLNKKYPDNIAVLLQLGRLALGTNQLDKAVERLKRVVSLDADNSDAHCLLAETYSKMGNSELAKKEFEICDLK